MLTAYFQSFKPSLNQSKQLEQYLDFLLKKNQQINLVSFRTTEELIIKHFLDSAQILNFIPIEKNQSVLDIGTGAGFPGLILSILRPEGSFVLFDSIQKKTRVLAELIKLLEIKNVVVYTGRAENLGQEKKWREKFTYVVSRAVAKLPTLLEYSLPFVKTGGFCICYKGRNWIDEEKDSQSALKILGGSLAKVFTYQLPKNLGERSLLLIKKIAPTPMIYPRAVGLPRKRPLS